jgi:hypothetical protein
MYKVTLQFETCKPSYKGKSLWTLTKEFNDLRHCDNFIAHMHRTKGYLLDECWYDSGFPFNEGDTYYTIEETMNHAEYNLLVSNGENPERYVVVKSCWDDISEELFDKNKLYFVSKTQAQKYITQTTI